MLDSALDPVLASLSYELVEMLRTFGEAQSFKDVAAQYRRDERTVSRQFMDVDQAFAHSQGVHILEREPGRKTYRLTTAGRIFVDLLGPISDATRSAINAATAASKRVPLLCTSNCLSYFRDLGRELRLFDIVPLPRRTAEIDLSGKPLETNVCLLSALMSSDQEPSVGAVTQLNPTIEVLPLQVDTLQLLTTEDLGFRRPVSVREVVEAGITFLTPPGGVAFDFLNRSFPDWRALRPFQHIPVPDLDYGLKCLAGKLIPRSAMVVHGFDPGVYGLANANLQGFAADNSSSLVAVTGVFHSRLDFRNVDQTDSFELVWQAAQTLWSTKEPVT